MVFLPEAWDLRLFSLLNEEWRAPFLDWFMPLCSMSALLWLLSIGLLAWAARRQGSRRTLGLALLLLAALALTDASSNALKHAVGRVRPLNALAGAHFREDGHWQRRPSDFVQTKTSGSSYPSAHAANSMAAALILALGIARLKPWIFAMPLLVGYSRVYLAKHYPTDVLAGWALGLVVAGVFWLFWNMCAPRHFPFPRTPVKKILEGGARGGNLF